MRLVLDDESGTCKGFGFVYMDKYEEACLAVKNAPAFSLKQRELKTKFKNAPFGKRCFELC